MKILLHATGEKSRLHPLTDHIALPMLPVLNRPVMAYAIEVLARQNVKNIDVTLHHYPGQIEAHFDDGSNRGVNLNYHLLRDIWGDAGSVRRTFSAPDDVILLVPADILIDLDLESLMEFHQSHSGGLTAVVSKCVANSPEQPYLHVEGTQILGVMNSFDRVQAHTAQLPLGVFVIDPRIVQKISYRKRVDMVAGLLPDLLARGYDLNAYSFDGYWNILENFCDYQKAQFDILDGGNSYNDLEKSANTLKYLTWEGRQISDDIWVGRNNVIYPNVGFASKVYIDQNCRIEKDVQVGPDVIIGKNVVVDQGATLRNTIVFDNSYIGRLLNIESKIVYKNLLIDIQTGEAIYIRDEFLLTETQDEDINLRFRKYAGIFLAIGLCIFLSPLMLIIAALLAITGSSVIEKTTYIHSVARANKIFGKYVFRNITLFRYQTRNDDSSYRFLGRFLEYTQIYRWLELFNIIKGDIAFVGVKPLTESQIVELNEEWQQTRFSVPAGFTGLWYVRTQDSSSFDEILIADAYYAAIQNWKVDLKILAQTPKAWINKVLTKPLLPIDQGEANLWN